MNIGTHLQSNITIEGLQSITNDSAVQYKIEAFARKCKLGPSFNTCHTIVKPPDCSMFRSTTIHLCYDVVHLFTQL